LLVNILPVLVGGGCVEFTQPKFDAVKVWERIKLGGINLFSAVPTIYVRLLQHWEKWSPGIDAVERELYQTALSNIEQFHCGSAALPASIASKWAALCRGRQIAERYGGTEFGNPFTHSPGVPVVPVSSNVISPSGTLTEIFRAL
jgi:malonyl-CoA/methylmalonyl-CoA synthetase